MSTVTQTPGTVLRLKVRDSAGVDQDLFLPIRVSETPWFSQKDPSAIKTLAMEDWSGRGYGGFIKDTFNAGTDLTKRHPFVRVLDNGVWWSQAQGRCLQVYGGDAANNPVASDFKFEVTFEGSRKLGAEIVFGFLNEMLEEASQLSLVLEQFDLINESRAQMRYQPNLQILTYEDSAGVFQTLDSAKAIGSLESGTWGYMRVEADFSKTPPAFIEIQLGDKIYTTVKDVAILVQADTTAKKTGLELHLWNPTTAVHGVEFFIRFMHLYRLL